MTKEEILAMKPGRELDALVAEKVMGWEVVSFRHCWEMPNGELRTREQTSYKKFSPSIDIAAAWEVVEKMDMFGKLGYLLHRMADTGRWYIAENNYGDLIGIAGGDTASEAICKAALLDVGVE